MKSFLLAALLICSFKSYSQTQLDRITSKCQDQVLMHLKKNTDISEIPNATLSVYELNTTLTEVEEFEGGYKVTGAYNAILTVSSLQLNGDIEQSVTGDFNAIVKPLLDDYIVSEFKPISNK